MKVFVLMRDHILPALEPHRPQFEAMYSPLMGRPEIDPVFLTGFCLLQMQTRQPDRAAVSAGWYDVRWRLALGMPHDWKGFDPSLLVRFRNRLAMHGNARLALESGLEAMRRAGYLKAGGAVRIDSTHLLGLVADLSRLECLRETLRLALNFLREFGGADAWEPWLSRYVDPNPSELRKASKTKLHTTFVQAGADALCLLEKAADLSEAVSEAAPIALLRRVFHDQFESDEGDSPTRRATTPAGSVVNPHDPQVSWCTKTSLGKEGWLGYKQQISETAPEQPRRRGEPTEAVITAVVVQSATTSDRGSLGTVLAAHAANGMDPPAEVFADAGYVDVSSIKEATTQGYELVGPVPAPPHSLSRFGTDRFAVDLPAQQATCPAGIASCQCTLRASNRHRDATYLFAWSSIACSSCPLQDECLSGKTNRPFRTLVVGAHHMAAQARRDLCKTPEYRIRMKRRNAIEGSVSEVKRGGGMSRCRYRGSAKTDVQAQFSAAACNLRRWAARLAWLARQTI